MARRSSSNGRRIRRVAMPTASFSWLLLSCDISNVFFSGAVAASEPLSPWIGVDDGFIQLQDPFASVGVRNLSESCFRLQQHAFSVSRFILKRSPSFTLEPLDHRIIIPLLHLTAMVSSNSCTKLISRYVCSSLCVVFRPEI